MSSVLGGAHGLPHWDSLDDEPVELGIDVDSLRWRLQLHPRGASVDELANETLHDGREEIFRADALGNLVFRGERRERGKELALRSLASMSPDDTALRTMAAVIGGIGVYHDPDLFRLRTQGSRTTDDQRLDSRGGNALTMLRKWFQERPNRFRHDFVLGGLQDAFPRLIDDLDFDEAGTTLVVRIYPAGREAPTPLGTEANGLLAMLVLLCDLAAAEEGSIVAIDEPEQSLHPYAIRRFWSCVETWSRRRKLTVLLATHSTVLLDALEGQPERVWVLRRDEWPGPVRLDELYERDWLANFTLGQLQVDGELGSNDDGI